MSATIIDGRALSDTIRDELAEEVEAVENERGFEPGLAVILVGEDEASKIYVRNKERSCEAIGIHSEVIRMPEETSHEEVLGKVRELNDRDEIDGILVQWPVPDQVDFEEVVDNIDPEKDVDGFHPINAGKLMAAREGLVPCTPQGIIEMLKRYDVAIEGKQATIVGRSDIVGKPVAMLLMHNNATITVCHSRTQDLASHTKRADILIAAVGRAEMITKDMVKPGAAVIDVGINRVDGKLVGDVAFDEVKEVASAITPVPGGVGPMTITMLLKNTVEAAKMRSGLDI